MQRVLQCGWILWDEIAEIIKMRLNTVRWEYKVYCNEVEYCDIRMQSILQWGWILCDENAKSITMKLNTLRWEWREYYNEVYYYFHIPYLFLYVITSLNRIIFHLVFILRKLKQCNPSYYCAETNDAFLSTSTSEESFGDETLFSFFSLSFH